VESVTRITALLIAEARHRSRQRGKGSLAEHARSVELEDALLPGTSHPDGSVDSVSFSSAGSECLFDNHIFRLDAVGKAAVSQELQDPAMQEALQWSQSGGWWLCASYGEVCTCQGTVRMVDADRKVEATVKADLAGRANLSVKCDISSFGSQDVNPGGLKLCECAHPVGAYHLHKRLTSKSYLQEAWILLLRILGRSRLLPAGTGDRTYHGMQNWGARHTAANMPQVLERVWIEQFVKQIVAPSAVGPRCLDATCIPQW